MDKRERRQFARIERCLIAMSSLGPSNPADMAAIARAWATGTRASESLWRAIEAIGWGEWADADEYIVQAENLLNVTERKP